MFTSSCLYDTDGCWMSIPHISLHLHPTAFHSNGTKLHIIIPADLLVLLLRIIYKQINNYLFLTSSATLLSV